LGISGRLLTLRRPGFAILPAGAKLIGRKHALKLGHHPSELGLHAVRARWVAALAGG